MKNLFTLPLMAALATASLGAQAQFTVDGTLAATEVGTGTGKYQLVGTFAGTHSKPDRGLKALYVGTTATTLNVMIVASPEINEYNSMVFYLDVPNKTGIAANTQLPGSSNSGNGGRESLRQRPTLDMPVDYGFRLTTSPFLDANNAIYLSRVDYTVTPGANGYDEIGMGAGRKDGTLTTDANDPAGAKTAFQTSATGSVAANTTTGWEFEIPLAALGGAAAGSNLNMMVAYIDDFKSFNSDVLPSIATQTTALGIDPNFTTIPGKQFYTYQVGTGVLATRTGSAPALQAAAYPNPLAATSRLAYTVPTSAQPVTVEVYNSLGQKALSLVNATQAAGRHDVALAPLHGLAAGSYLVTLRVGQYLSRHRVVVE
ncbi:T9SS type A sorting domain-containing protein [Hymenobacter sp. BT683]|uniref:T9SS type A sorting domain-containing protein n=1 Tax=Hymenobacter jeongseonensis TaxID=2791027 RepID=A0ABS0IM65_9BACT|nr:T9SS type A sorting domain-containing protein [Hymenobacter jeongseonensis]MBF9239292.1 T9SS type A sorting domain-containing protein [Hymenobacter jeongseonensis]